MSVTTSHQTARRRGGALTRTDPARPESVPAIRNALVAFATEAGLSGRKLECIRLAASEAVTNAVIHAYRTSHAGRVYVSAWIADGRLAIHIADDGEGLRPHSPRAGLGLGLALIARSCDGFEIVDRAAGGTELRLAFELPPG